eukprot:5441721-Lingulodinium_polyedra.AAC.1
MRGPWQAEPAQIANQLARATEVVAGRDGEIQEFCSQVTVAVARDATELTEFRTKLELAEQQ